MNNNITVTDYDCLKCKTKKYIKKEQGWHMVKCACFDQYRLGHKTEEEALTFLDEIAEAKRGLLKDKLSKLQEVDKPETVWDEDDVVGEEEW